jgi:hypothetical protein
MPINYINTGSSPNKGDGDTLRTAFNKINENFSTLVQEIGSTSSYVLPVATTSTLGGIKVGANLTISNGILSATSVASTPFTGTVAVLTATQSINLNGIILSNSSGTLSAITITGTATEPYVELLLHADDFTEDSTNSVPILSNGVTVNTGQKRFGVGSFYFDGGSYISLPGSASNPNFDQAGDITIEFWAYVDTFNVGNIICSEGISGNHWAIENAGGKLYFQCNDGVTSSEIIPGTNLPVSQWTHCAVVKSGTNVTIYQNGGSIGSVNIGSSTAFNDTVYDIAIGSISNGSFGFFEGYLDEIRISRGIALYTGSFTPPTAPFPGDTIIIASALPPIVTNVSHFTNDANYLTSSTVNQYVNSFTVTNISYFTNDKNYITATDVTSQGYLTSSTVNQYVNSFTVTNVSYFTNDAGYLTATDVTLLADTLDSVLARGSSTVQTITAGHIVPSADKQYDLGTSSTQWRSLYVGTSTIYIDNIALSIDATNNTVVVGPNEGRAILASQDYVNIAIDGIPAGPKGDQGVQGNTGTQGVQGPIGPQGIQGNTGTVGIQGPIGNTGTQGVQGPIGDTGAQGISIVLVGSSATTTVESLGAGSAGQGWINTTNGAVYFWNTLTTQWENIGPIVGPQGERGLQGVQGEKGDQGIPGAQGETGAQGSTGTQGVAGPTGPKGDQGIQGNTGTQGLIGPTGPKGDRGDVGLTGATGAQGATGPQGATGTAATITLGTVTVSTSTASVTNVGTTSSAIFNFVLQQGPQGIQGVQGPQGPAGGGNTGTIWTNSANGCLRAELSATGFQAFTDATHLDLQDSGQWNVGSYQYSTVIGNDEFTNTNILSLRSGDETYITTNLRENGNHQWKFGTDGLLTLPNGASIGSSGSLSGIPMTTDRGTVLFGNSPECVPTLLTHFHIMKDDTDNVDLFLGDDNNYVKLPGNGETAYGVEIGTNVGDGANTWRFGTDGVLTLPQGGTIADTTTTMILTPNSPGQATSLVLRSTYNSYMTADYPTDQGYQQYLHQLDPVTWPDPHVSTGTEGTVISITLWDASGLQYVQGDVEYIITGTGITAQDFTPAVLTGTFAAANWTLDGGGFNYTNTNMLMIADDAIVEGEETFTITIITTGTYGHSNGSNYLRVNIADGTTEGSESGHIHLISENMAQTSIFLGNDDKYVKVGSDDQIYINVPNVDNSATSHTWTFDGAGVLTLPSGNTRIGDISGGGFQDFIIGSTGTLLGVVVHGQSGAGALQWVDNFENLGTTSTEVAAVIVNSPFASTTGTVQILTGISNGFGSSNTWEFGADGNLTIPDDIQDANGSVVRVATTSTAPTRVDGQLWFNSEEGRMYVKYNGQWIDASPAVVPTPDTYLDEITIDGSTLNINGGTLTISNTGTLLVNGSEVTGSGTGSSTHIEYTDGQSQYTSTVDLGYNFEVDTQYAHLDINGDGTWEIGSNNFDTKIFSTEDPGNEPKVIVVRAGDEDWTFGPLGWFTLPGGSVIKDGMGQFRFEPSGASSSTQALLIYPTGSVDGNHIHLTAGGGGTDLYLGDDDQYVKVDHSGTIVVGTLGATTSTWTFGTDGMLTLPEDGIIQVVGNNALAQLRWVPTGGYTGSTATAIQANSTGVTILVDAPSNENEWTFGTDGVLTLPADTPIIKGGGTGTDVTVIAGTEPVGIFEGSLEFIGSGTILLSPGVAVGGVGDTGNGSFTIDAWVKFSEDPATHQQYILGSNFQNGFSLFVGDGQATPSATKITVDCQNVSNTQFEVPALTTNTWYHIAVARNSSGMASVWVNGVRSTTGATGLGYSGSPFTGLTTQIGSWSYNNTTQMLGNVGQVRIVTGNNVYNPNNSTITVPTADLQTVTGTQLLLLMKSVDQYGDDTENNTLSVYSMAGSTTLPAWTTDAPTTEIPVTWTFGQDGSVTFPDDTVQTTAWLGGNASSLATTANSSNNFNIGNFINNASLDITYTAFTGDYGIDFDISYQVPLDGTKGVTVGAVETPLILSTGTVILKTDISSSTSTWTFGTDGGLTLPNGGTLRMSTAPTSSTGAAGDKAGTIAVNSASIFYCIADYYLDTGTYYVTTTNSNDGSVFFIEIAKGSYTQPQIGWGVSIGGNITQIDGATTDLGTSWRISVGAVTAYSTGTSVTLTNPSPSQSNIWVKQAWGTTGSW